MDDDDNEKKRKPEKVGYSQNEEEPQQSSNKRQRINNVVLEEIVPDRRNIIETLSQFGRNLVTSSGINMTTPAYQVSEEFRQLQEEINEALTNALNEAQAVVIQNEQDRKNQENAAMAEAEYSQHQQLHENFMRKLQPLRERMISELTYGEQAQMFNIILNSINNRLNENNYNQSEPNQVVVLMELASITYQFTLELLSVTISNIYQATPAITTQLVSLITASAMVYNYLPSDTRSLYTTIPYLGGLFTLMNRVNPLAVRIQNSAAIVTTIYYLLRNAGIDTTSMITSIGSTAREILTSSSMVSGRFVMSGINSGRNFIADSYTSFLDIMSNRLADIFSKNYEYSQALRLYESSLTENSQLTNTSSTSSSMSSISSERTINISESGISNITQSTIRSVDSLLNTPLSEGGIDFTPNIPGKIVEHRLDEILTQEQDEEEEPKLHESVSSYMTESEPEHWSVWLFGKPSKNDDESDLEGGRKRRHYKKTKKHFKKRHRVTKKHKKHSKRMMKKYTKKNVKKNTKNRRRK